MTSTRAGTSGPGGGARELVRETPPSRGDSQRARVVPAPVRGAGEGGGPPCRGGGEGPGRVRLRREEVDADSGGFPPRARGRTPRYPLRSSRSFAGSAVGGEQAFPLHTNATGPAIACFDDSTGSTAAGTCPPPRATTRTVFPGLNVSTAARRRAWVFGSSLRPTITTSAGGWSQSSAARKYAPPKIAPMREASPAKARISSSWRGPDASAPPRGWGVWRTPAPTPLLARLGGCSP